MIEVSFEKSVDPGKLQVLFRQTGWATGRSTDDIRTMLEGTPLALGAWDGDRLVGFARAITDGTYRALIDDVVVDESRRGKGIGAQLMKRLLERLTGIEEVVLLCEQNAVSFYGRYGFKRPNCEVMSLRRG